jgi:allophanate hydrolase subunit 2
VLVENIEAILVIERLEIRCYLLKLKEKPAVSMNWKFGARRIQVPPSGPPIILIKSITYFMLV